VSPLESHHASLFSRIMMRRGFLKEMPDGYRKIVVTSILGTDMSKHGALLGVMQTSDISEDPQCLITCCTHCADLGAQVLPEKSAWEFYVRINTENNAQVRSEKELGLPVTSFMQGLEDAKVAAQGQVSFLEFVVAPLWKACSIALPTKKMLDSQEQDSDQPKPEPPIKKNASEKKTIDPHGHDNPPKPADGTGSQNNKRSVEGAEWLEFLGANLEIYKYISANGKKPVLKDGTKPSDGEEIVWDVSSLEGMLRTVKY